MSTEPTPPRPKRRYIRFTRWRRRRFFALLAQSGNVRMAAELSGVGLGCVYRLRRTEAGFSEAMAAAVETASGVLREAASVTEEGPSTAVPAVPLPSKSRGGKGSDPCLVVRRGIGGRLRVMMVGTRWWTEWDDRVFLGHLRATGNVRASARAAGFTPKSAWNRRARVPAFALAWDEALDEAELRLEEQLIAQAGGACSLDDAIEPAQTPPLDTWLAMWLLSRWQRKRDGPPRRRRR